MILDGIYEQGKILGAALNASSLRNDVTTNNIANADVPGYKAKAVDFEAALTSALERSERTGIFDLSDATPSVRYTNEGYNYRIDKNNVDIELEMVNLYENSVRFETMINCLQSNSKRLNLVLTGR